MKTEKEIKERIKKYVKEMKRIMKVGLDLGYSERDAKVDILKWVLED